MGEISTEQKKNVEFLVGGGAKSYDEYRHICGVIRGLTQAEFLIKTLCKDWKMMTTEFDVEAIDLSGVLNTSPEQKAKQLPDPKTFRLLCVVPEAMEEFADSEIGIIKVNPVNDV
jgi:hypothetical protein